MSFIMFTGLRNINFDPGIVLSDIPILLTPGSTIMGPGSQDSVNVSDKFRLPVAKLHSPSLLSLLGYFSFPFITL